MANQEKVVVVYVEEDGSRVVHIPAGCIPDSDTIKTICSLVNTSASGRA